MLTACQELNRNFIGCDIEFGEEPHKTERCSAVKSRASWFFCCHIAVNSKTRTVKSLEIRGFQRCRIIPIRKTNLNLKQICLGGLAQFDCKCVRLH